ncbi:MAG: hypothetical protein IPP73_05150 [Chitinophagaceae bacterium]|nr:hypothetical protein [Chitinophagaceae bacterium]
MNSITPADMMKLQNNYYNVQAAYMYPLMMKYTQTDKLLDAKSILQMVKAGILMPCLPPKHKPFTKTGLIHSR